MDRQLYGDFRVDVHYIPDYVRERHLGIYSDWFIESSE